MIEQNNILFAFLITSLAGLSTVLGALLVFFFRKNNTRLLPLGLGFSAGIMMYLSFFDLLREAHTELLSSGTENVNTSVALFFIIGLTLAGVIDILTHKYINTCIWTSPQFKNKKNQHGKNKHYNHMLLKTGLFSMFALTLHNFPEGIATFSATTVNVSFGISIALAIAIHNIPEGFCIALPIFHATNSYKKSLFYTTIAALAEPLGALTAFLFLYPFITEYIMGGILALVAGIMVYVSIDSLLPTAKKLGQWHTALGSMIAGMLVMLLVSHFIF
ncbi:MAG: zinc transporter ZupT [Candidatus Magasanikbacteria bacterium]|jgi:zinc transporter, ZIP family|nr:zinc transporter ZupT [Candidatus Magasanikbacteria bacterium]MBT4071302.1 zinc transporter ZupT [Candidatus Magasanikbacteria bacterium]